MLYTKLNNIMMAFGQIQLFPDKLSDHPPKKKLFFTKIVFTPPLQMPPAYEPHEEMCFCLLGSFLLDT